MLNIVLLEPEIPENTGNIGRTCVAAGARLHLIEPLGFHLTQRNIKRAGMDYWERLDLSRYSCFEDFLEKNPRADRRLCPAGARPDLFLATTKGRQLYTQAAFGSDSYIMFGKESAGIPEEILMDHPQQCIRIPMMGDTRSLNLANSVAIVLYEALRQTGFAGMNTQGELHHHSWGGQESDL